MFAGLNLLRFAARQKLDVKEFEFCQNYLMFWDKLERANYFFEAIIDSADRDVDDRSVAFLLDGPLSDGGQWNMFINLVESTGSCRKRACPRRTARRHSRRMNGCCAASCAKGAQTLRDDARAGRHARRAAGRKARVPATSCIASCASISARRPSAFAGSGATGRHVPSRPSELTPQAVRRRVRRPAAGRLRLPGARPAAGQPVRADVYRAVSRQRRRRPTGDLSERRDGADEAIAQRTLEAGEPVWFGCDVGKQMRRDLGLMDRDLYDLRRSTTSTFEWTRPRGWSTAKRR